MKAVVTGANGYIGSHLVNELAENNHTVIAVDYSFQNIKANSINKTTDIYCDDINCFEEFEKPDVLIHLACKNVPIHNSLYHIETIPKNFKFIKNMIDNGLKHVVTVGSMHDIGYYEGCVPEDAEPHPMSFYGVSKDTLRKLVEIYTKDKDVTYQHLRFFYTYGDDELSSGSIFSKILEMAKNGQKTFPFTDGKNQFDYLEIHELARQIRAVVEQKEVTGIINCCSGKPTAIKDKVEEFIKQNGLDIKPDYGKYPTRPYDSPCIYGATEKINKILKNNFIS